MTSWPTNWIGKALASLNVPPNGDTIAIIRAWKNSTPLPPYSNNPLGMPKGTSGAPAYLNTPYAIFPSMTKFYAALATFGQSQAGKSLTLAMHGDAPFPATWRAIASLQWPGSATETDYPSAVLDLTTASYRASVNATPKPDRKTSGALVASPDSKAQVLGNARALADAARAFDNANHAVTHLIRRAK